MKKRTKALLLSMLGLCCSSTIVVGGTYSLFTGQVTVSNHLKAGNLTVGLHRVKFVGYDLVGGIVEATSEDTTRVDLTKTNTPIFNFGKAVPCAKQSATLEVSNGGAVAFDYGMRILLTTVKDDPSTAEKEDELSEKFADQIYVTVFDTEGKQVKADYLSDWTGDVNFDGYLSAGEDVETFTVTAEFKDLPNNNDVMNASLEFSVQVFATQWVE